MQIITLLGTIFGQCAGYGSLVFWRGDRAVRTNSMFFTEFLSAAKGWCVGSSKKQCAVIAWRSKIACAMASGTTQRTEGFCSFAKNWVLREGALTLQRFPTGMTDT